jgi:uncharacterized repeat protein (TIGR03803 family)
VLDATRFARVWSLHIKRSTHLADDPARRILHLFLELFSALIDVQGKLYGTTSSAEQYGEGGTAFSVSTDGIEEVLHRFAGGDGSVPLADLKNVKGVLYGTTSEGGENNVGTVFSITKSGQETVLHSFSNGTGMQPRAGLAAVAGTLYGTTYGGSGTVYSLKP